MQQCHVPGGGNEDELPGGGRRPFVIISDLNGKVIDVYGGHAHSGTHLCMYTRKKDRGALNQQWYLDMMGNIRSMLNDFAPECKAFDPRAAQGEKIKMEKYRGDSRQQWIFEENRIVNRQCPDECFDIERASREDEAHVIVWPYKGTSNQHWRIDYV